MTTLPPYLTTINQNAFYKCPKITLSTLPSGVTSISTGVFRYCTGITTFTIPGTVTGSVGGYAFGSRTGLTSVTFEGTPSSISKTAFSSCSNLTEIKVPWSSGAVANAPWGATNATITYNYAGGSSGSNTDTAT